MTSERNETEEYRQLEQARRRNHVARIAARHNRAQREFGRRVRHALAMRGISSAENYYLDDQD